MSLEKFLKKTLRNFAIGGMALVGSAFAANAASASDISSSAAGIDNSNQSSIEVVVDGGDTLYSITKDNCSGTDYTYFDIADFNGIDNPDSIFAGQKIKLPSGCSLEERIDQTSGISSVTEKPVKADVVSQIHIDNDSTYTMPLEFASDDKVKADFAQVSNPTTIDFTKSSSLSSDPSSPNYSIYQDVLEDGYVLGSKELNSYSVIADELRKEGIPVSYVDLVQASNKPFEQMNNLHKGERVYIPNGLWESMKSRDFAHATSEIKQEEINAPIPGLKPNLSETELDEVIKSASNDNGQDLEKPSAQIIPFKPKVEKKVESDKPVVSNDDQLKTEDSSEDSYYYIDYTVKKGDTLGEIAKTFNVPYDRFYSMIKHQLPDPEKPGIINPGDEFFFKVAKDRYKGFIPGDIMGNRERIIQLSPEEFKEVRFDMGVERLGDFLGFDAGNCYATKIGGTQRKLDNLILNYEHYEEFSKEHGIDIYDALGRGAHESAETFCSSTTGSLGDGGLTSFVYLKYGINPFIPEEGIEGMIRYMDEMNDWFGRTIGTVAYNRGPKEALELRNHIRELGLNITPSVFDLKDESGNYLISTSEGRNYYGKVQRDINWAKSQPELAPTPEGEILRVQRIEDLANSDRIYELRYERGGEQKVARYLTTPSLAKY